MDLMRFNDFYLRFYNAELQTNSEALISEFYALWCEAEESGVPPDTLMEETEDCIHRIVTTDLFTLAASEWIGNKAHYSISKALAHQVSIHYLQHPTVVRFDLSKVLQSSANAVARRLCALDVPVPVSLGWILSLHEDLPSSPKVLRTTSRVIDFLTAEHPATCKRLLEAEKSPFTYPGVVQNTLENLTIKSKELDALPSLIELQMSSEMRRSFRYMRLNENRTITEQIQGQSLFELFTTAQHFKYSNQVAVEYKNNTETVDAMIPMFTHEMSIELPQTWTADPLLYGQMRIHMWSDSD